MATRVESGPLAGPVAAPGAAALSFDRFGGACALLAGAAGLLYSVSFVVLKHVSPELGDMLSALFLLLGGLLTTAALLALYEHLQTVSAPFARWGLLLGLIGAAGSILHGGYDLANALHPPATPNLDLPSAVDPRGLLTFGVAGLGLLVLARLLTYSPAFPRRLAWLGYLTGALLVFIYLSRLIVLDATSPVILVPALLAGFVVNPFWYGWLGAVLWRGR